MPDIPEPSSFHLTKDLFIDQFKIVENILKMFNKKLNKKDINKPKFHDVPGEWFGGPF
jgi:pyruvate dehydrogenase E1 component beta subunit